MDLRSQFRPALVMLVLLTVLTGLVYPLGFTAIAQLLFAAQANGSLIMDQGRAVGSTLIAQPFDDPRYFWGRLSATAPFSDNAAASSGSNQGPLSDALIDAAKARRDALRAADPTDAPIPIDLLTASASGLDPHISPAAARYPGARRARGAGPRPHRPAHGGSPARPPRRAEGERARAEPRAGWRDGPVRE